MGMVCNRLLEKIFIPMFLGNLLNLVKACSLFKESFDVLFSETLTVRLAETLFYMIPLVAWVCGGGRREKIKM